MEKGEKERYAYEKVDCRIAGVLVPLGATPAVWAGTLPGGENESALVMVENMEDVSITETFFPDEGFPPRC